MASIKHMSIRGVHKKAFRGLFHTLIPHEGNDYHPHLIRPLGIALVLAAVVVLQFVAITPKVGSVKGAQTDFSRQALLAESNNVREANDVPLLNLNNDLNSAAGLKARDVLVRQYWSHVAPDGTTPWYWFREVNYKYDYAGENLAKGFQTPSGVVTAWMNSEEHRRNALSKDYQDVGFGVAEGMLNGEQTTVVVALYGSPLGSEVLTSSEVLAATDGNMSLITRFGIGLQSLSPTTLGSIALLSLTLIVGLLTYAFRKKLPPSMQKSWKRHHGLYKSLAVACLILVLITLYGDGQIL
jgi:uncharacterized protein YkwD